MERDVGEGNLATAAASALAAAAVKAKVKISLIIIGPKVAILFITSSPVEIVNISPYCTIYKNKSFLVPRYIATV